MDEQEKPGWDPRVTKIFRKIINTSALGLSWLMAVATAGLYFKVGHFDGKPIWQPLLFYFLVAVSFWLLFRFLYKTWKDEM